MTQEPVIQVENLNVSYDGVEVLRDVHFSVNEGEFVSIVGKSGCGKSTLLFALAGFIESSGDVRVPRDIGMVFQSYAVFPWLTVEGNIAFGLRHLSREKRRHVIDDYLKLVGLEVHAHKYPAQLSGGEAQRVALARALAPTPRVIFMDEPFGALDMFTRDQMQEWLVHLWEKERKTVLFVTHNIEEAVLLSSRIVMLSAGGTIDEVEVDLPRPRTGQLKFSSHFIDLKRRILEMMDGMNSTEGDFDK